MKKINVNLRLIVATNKNLSKLIKEGKFREDLYYRINVISFHLLPLRKRREDIPLLIDHFINKYNKRYNKKIISFDENVINRLSLYDWPGNVRELENYVNQIVLLCDKEIISEDDLKKNNLVNNDVTDQIVNLSEIKSLKGKIDEIVEIYEKKIIEESLIKNNNNRTKTAGDMDITRKTLRIKMNKYKIKPKNN